MTRLVWLLPAGSSDNVRRYRWICPTTVAVDASQTEEEVAHRFRDPDPQDVAKCPLRECRVVRTSHGLAISGTVSMKKPPTGEPLLRKPPARFGGRGGENHPDPYHDGYRFEAGRRFVRKKSLNKLKDSIRAKTGRCGGNSLGHVIASLNPMSCRMHASRMTRLVWLLQAGSSADVRRSRWICPTTVAVDASQAEEEIAHRIRDRDPQDVAECLLRECRAVRTSHGLASSETVSMKKPPTGEPLLRKPPARFGGRGRHWRSLPLSGPRGRTL